ncbi:very short patch repair endonuclease [Mycobacterium avium]|nr:very short patch repair endonuclease [Mycobacterium avium]MBZ4557571.1 very short patch repair endonuclease [Mycobacterium avium subsp. hominissuis]MBZ4567311.1 very short patch repair endonuclease [Mycobacterium avium subsp. hominissuis]MBZ4577952.1 very short patch repair endonuclease [Mycobacterium avium subsp. hominissuis]MBZ4586148.1 very short patch repair endonuclease [Mycobacterium avium subsp. hominissuis]MBZ4605866.1 very short patch repair endonuclease [Mycobacterium avium subsp.
METPEPLDDSTRRRMRSQRRRDTALESRIRKSLHRSGFRFRVDHRPEKSLRCRGDIVFTRLKVIVFVDGCFWHGCPRHATSPTNNAEWWREKLDANVERDRRNDQLLKELGWRVVRIWEHEETDEAVDRIRAALNQARSL